MQKFKRIGLSTVLLAICGMLAFCVGEPLTWKMRKRSEAMTALSAAKTKADLEKAGFFIPVGESEWIAIDYHDTHSGRIDSIAVALTSEGHWLESGRHFCGAFSAYRHMRAIREEMTALADPEIPAPKATTDVEIVLDSVFAASSLRSAENELAKLGFLREKLN